MSGEYVWKWLDDEGNQSTTPGEYEVECDSCASHVPVSTFKSSTEQTRGFEKVMRELCEICACTHAGNATAYPSQYPSREAMILSVACTNQILLHMGKFGPVPPLNTCEADDPAPSATSHNRIVATLNAYVTTLYTMRSDANDLLKESHGITERFAVNLIANRLTRLIGTIQSQINAVELPF